MTPAVSTEYLHFTSNAPCSSFVWFKCPSPTEGLGAQQTRGALTDQRPMERHCSAPEGAKIYGSELQSLHHNAWWRHTGAQPSPSVTSQLMLPSKNNGLSKTSPMMHSQHRHFAISQSQNTAQGLLYKCLSFKNIFLWIQWLHFRCSHAAGNYFKARKRGNSFSCEPLHVQAFFRSCAYYTVWTWMCIWKVNVKVYFVPYSTYVHIRPPANNDNKKKWRQCTVL